jgi:hypothetical protein
MMGMHDKLITPTDVICHFEALRAHRPALASAKLFVKRGHIDFTYGLDDEVVADVFRHC